MKEIEPIAYFRSPFTTKFGIPRQSGLVSELRGRIVFEPKFSSEDALRGLEGFDYVWLIWGFSANEPVGGKRWNEDDSLMVRPPRLGGNEKLESLLHVHLSDRTVWACRRCELQRLAKAS